MRSQFRLSNNFFSDGTVERLTVSWNTFVSTYRLWRTRCKVTRESRGRRRITNGDDRGFRASGTFGSARDNYFSFLIISALIILLRARAPSSPSEKRWPPLTSTKRPPAEVIDRGSPAALPVLTCLYTRAIRTARILRGQARMKKARAHSGDSQPRLASRRERREEDPLVAIGEYARREDRWGSR